MVSTLPLKNAPFLSAICLAPPCWMGTLQVVWLPPTVKDLHLDSILALLNTLAVHKHLD